ncbi:MAG: molybdopterin-dependent oxidoreductase [Eubacterium sp.]|nr:molybdopterin-dependent oxidoreductase [Eubacterium sp.]MDD7209071.1 molybdopterin-dependent oxidoreductase [Lachnospiraceae bacterium]MDY5496415.1 xanthine dehydrogenase subunit XdhA [Anaerobutyricum sp.]
MKVVGQGKTRVDAFGKVTGEAKYTADLEPKDILHGKVVHSTIANGLVKSFDLEEALKVPGVVKIITCFDVPDTQFSTAGHPWSVELGHRDISDRKLLNQRVRLYGDDIAAVIAENEVAAARAARLIKVEYEEYEPIVTVEAAMKEGATPLHPDIRKDNVLVHSHMTMVRSDFTFEEGLKEAREKYGEDNIVVLEETYRTPRISHCHIELPVSWAYVDTNGKVTITSSTQIPHIVRRCTAQALGIDIGKVRIIKPYIGGGFGNKQDMLYEPLNALMTLAVGGRPVRLEISREEAIYATRTRHAIEGRTKGIVTKDGRVLARKLEAYANNGAYASHGHAICANCGNVYKGLYRDELGTEVDCYTVYTSSPTAGAMRAYGIPQSVWIAECQADDMAEAIGMDPLEFRLKNCVQDGYIDPANGIRFYSYGLDECLKRGREYIKWDEKRKAYANQSGPVRRGVGMAMFMYKSGVYPFSLETAAVRMVLNQDGSIQLSMGATEIGQGADTVFTQMAAESTGISFDRVYVVSTQDTDTTPFDTGAYGSRQTYVSGMACKACGEELRRKILDYAAYMLNHDVSDISKTVYADLVKAAAENVRETLGLHGEDEITGEMLDIVDSKVVVSGGKPELFDVSVVAEVAFYSLDRSVHITAEITHQCKSNTFASGCCFVDIEVDMPLGIVTVKDIINVHDSGNLINPETAKGQVHGGMSMSLGFGLSEELLVDEKTGRVLNDNLLDYKMPTAMDVPDLKADFVIKNDPTGPYGNKALGEPPAIPVAPAIRNAILHATGVHMNTAPMTPQRLIEKFREQGLI